MTEHQIQNHIREILAYYHDLNIFRANVGKGYLCHKLNGQAGFTTPRWFDIGLPVGFPDLFGYKSITITPEMIGRKFAQFAFVEVKTPKGRISAEQQAIHDVFREAGAIGGIARSAEDSLEILNVRGVGIAKN